MRGRLRTSLDDRVRHVLESLLLQGQAGEESAQGARRQRLAAAATHAEALRAEAVRRARPARRGVARAQCARSGGAERGARTICCSKFCTKTVRSWVFCGTSFSSDDMLSRGRPQTRARLRVRASECASRSAEPSRSVPRGSCARAPLCLHRAPVFCSPARQGKHDTALAHQRLHPPRRPASHPSSPTCLCSLSRAFELVVRGDPRTMGGSVRESSAWQLEDARARAGQGGCPRARRFRVSSPASDV